MDIEKDLKCVMYIMYIYLYVYIYCMICICIYLIDGMIDYHHI